MKKLATFLLDTISDLGFFLLGCVGVALAVFIAVVIICIPIAAFLTIIFTILAIVFLIALSNSLTAIILVALIPYVWSKMKN